ncbi:hypothetical protein ACB092_03G089400 [Castanea dentata]
MIRITAIVMLPTSQLNQPSSWVLQLCLVIVIFKQLLMMGSLMKRMGVVSQLWTIKHFVII